MPTQNTLTNINPEEALCMKHLCHNEAKLRGKQSSVSLYRLKAFLPCFTSGNTVAFGLDDVFGLFVLFRETVCSVDNDNDNCSGVILAQDASPLNNHNRIHVYSSVSTCYRPLKWSASKYIQHHSYSWVFCSQLTARWTNQT